MTQRILVVIPNWFGEALFVTPFLRALRRQKPGAFLAVLGWPQTHEVLLGNPNLDLLLAFDEAARHRALAGWWRLAGKLRAHRFDTAFILRKSLSRTLLLACAGIPVRIGFANSKSGWLLTHRVAVASGAIHKAQSYLPLLTAIGLTGAAGRYEYVVTEQERLQAEEFLRAQGLQQGFALLHIGANWAHKRWPTGRFAALADKLIEEQGVQVAISGGPNDVNEAQAVQRAMRKNAVGLAGQTALRQLAACCLKAGVIVANDTGVMHIVAALDRPVVALFGPTAPAITGPLGDSATVIHHPDCCPSIPCYAPDNPLHLGMARISVDEVYASVCERLGRIP